MKHLLLFGVLCICLLACKGNKNNSENAETTETPAAVVPPPDMKLDEDGVTETTVIMDVDGNQVTVQKPLDALSSAISDTPKSIKDPTPPVIIAPQPKTPQESRVVRVLTNQYWIVMGLNKINDKPAWRKNQGAWFKFNENGTYEYGHFDRKIGMGAWTFDGKKAFVHLDSEFKGDDREWKIQIGNSDQIQVMVWTGTEKYGTTGTTLKLQNFLFIPKTRAEIGLDK